MNASNLTDTQPVQAQPPAPSKPKRRFIWFWALAILLLLSLGVSGGVLAGYRSGAQTLEIIRSEQLASSLKEQFDLGVNDLDAGRYEIARQRFQYILDKKPDYPGLTDKMAAVLTILYATATPTPVTPTPVTPTVTLTPTRDLRPVQDRFTQAIDHLRNDAWNDAIDVLLNLRKEEPTFQMTRVDGLLYLALRQRGVSKIYKESSLEGGIYDLSLAENFGPLDIEAKVARNLARLYLYGSSFWEAYPDLAVFYFGQVAAAAPYLRDASGWTAIERYRSSLIQYGDQLARMDEWCSALEQYQLAASIRGDAALSATTENAALHCAPPTETLAASATLSPTLGPTLTLTLTPPTVLPPTATETPTIPPPPTDTPAPPPTETPTPPPSDTSTPVDITPPAP